MIVDLERNDLGQISVPSSVKVTEFESIYTLPYVHHLVSTISARTKEGVSLEHIFKATFPGGSITGAPKLRARQIIAKYEPFKRGIYTGALGYIDRQGGCNLNIAIRTGIIKENKLCFFVGSGIVADSDPENEYRETLTKAKAFLNLTKKNEKKSELFGSLR
jgi:para-aminobenzoate synthetase component 1